MEPDEEAYLRGRFKTEIRRRIRALRKALPQEARHTRSLAITRNVLELDCVAEAKTIAGFIPIRGEVDTKPLLDELRTRGIRIALPRVDAEAGRIRLLLDEGERIPGVFGIPEPPPDAPEAEPDLILVPALAVDPRGHRIGYGKGFYDQLLASSPRATNVAIVFDFQLVSEVPEQAHDVPVDFIVTDTRTLVVDPAAA